MSRLEQIPSTPYVLRIPETSDRILRSLVVARELRSRQVLIEPIIESYATTFGPLVIDGLNSIHELLSQLGSGNFTQSSDFRRRDWKKMIEEHQESIKDRFPIVKPDHEEPFVRTGVRVSASSLIIFKTLAVLEGDIKVTPRIESLVHGYAQHMRETATEELATFAQKIQ